MNTTAAHWFLTGAQLELNASTTAAASAAAAAASPEAFDAEQALNATDAALSLGEATLNLSDAAAAADNATHELSSAELFLDSSRFWIQRVLVPIVVTVGVLGNLVTVVVLTRRRMRSSTNMYLTALAVSDLLYLIFMFSLSFEHYPGIRGMAYRRYWEYKPYGHWLTDANSSSSVWLTVSFTVERYIAVCHPLRGRVLCTESRARAVIAVVFVMCAFATITTPFEWKVVADENGWGIANTDLGNDQTYQIVFYWFTSFVFTILPLILLGIFNSFLVWAVHRSQRQRFRMTQVDQSETCSSSNQTQENRITIVLIAVVVLFMVCQLPSAGTLLYIGLHKIKDPHESMLLRGLGNIFNFLVAIHSSCNFLLYCALSDKYRRTFMLTFFRRCAPPPPPGSAAASAAFSTGSRLSVRGAASGAGASGPARGYSLRVHPAALGGGGGAAGGVGGAANGSLLAPPFRRHASAYIPRPRPAHSPLPRFTPDQTLAEVP